jgi:hypothetical protein
MEMFDTITETRIEADGTAQVSTMYDQSEAMDEACREFVAAERRFRYIDAHPDVVSNPRLNVQWWELLEVMYLCDKKVWRLFIGPQPTMADNMLYARFRERLLAGKSLRPDS